MEPEKDNQLASITWTQTYHQLSDLLLPDIMPIIFSFHCYASGIDYANLPDLIKESCRSPLSFMRSIQKLLESDNDHLATEIFERGFAHTKVSICNIKSGFNSTVLHFAIGDGCPKIVAIILTIAGDNKWELLTAKSIINGYTALHCVATQGSKIEGLFVIPTQINIEMATLLLDAAGKRAQELMDIGKGGITAFKIASPEIKEVMKTYRQTNQ